MTDFLELSKDRDGELSHGQLKILTHQVAVTHRVIATFSRSRGSETQKPAMLGERGERMAADYYPYLVPYFRAWS